MTWSSLYRRLTRRAPIAAVALLALACRGSTQITITVTTDVACDHFRGAAITVGKVDTIDGTSAASTTMTCDAGRVGALVIVPSGADDDAVAFRVVAGVDGPFDACLAPTPGARCIVARRALRFLPHTPLNVPVQLNAVCEGIPCTPGYTCVNRACLPATIDPSACTGDEGCPQGKLFPNADGGAPEDAGADATLADAGDASTDASIADASSDASIADASIGAVPGCDMRGLQPNAPWPMEGYCPAHRHRSPMRGPKQSPSLKWRVQLSAFVNDQPLVAADGTIYVVTRANEVRALQRDGGTKWSNVFDAGGGVLAATPAIAHDGALFAVDHNGAIYRFDPVAGARTIVPNVTVPSRAAIMIGPDGTLYMADNGQQIFAIDPAGAQRWVTGVGSGVDPQSPALGTNGVLYIQSSGALHALSPGDGGILSSFGYDGGNGFGTPAIAPSGTIVVAVDNGARAIRPGALATQPPTLQWDHRGAGGQVSYAIGDDGTAYFSTDNDGTTAIAPDGGVVAQYAPAGCGWPVIDADGWLYLICPGLELVALDPQLHERWNVSFAAAGAGGIPFDSPVIADDGTLYLTLTSQGGGPDAVLAFGL